MSLTNKNFRISDLTYSIEKRSSKRETKLFVSWLANYTNSDLFYKMEIKEHIAIYRRAVRMLLDQKYAFRAYRGCKVRFSHTAGCFILQHEDGPDADIFIEIHIELLVNTLSNHIVLDEWSEAKSTEHCEELDASTMVCSMEQFKEMLEDNGWSMDGKFNLHDTDSTYPVGCVEITDGKVFLFLNPVIA